MLEAASLPGLPVSDSAVDSWSESVHVFLAVVIEAGSKVPPLCARHSLLLPSASSRRRKQCLLVMLLIAPSSQSCERLDYC
jgi:hypothetical protein